MDGLTATYLVLFAAGLVFGIVSFAFGAFHQGGDAPHGADAGGGVGVDGHGADGGHDGSAGDHSADSGHGAPRGFAHAIGSYFAPLLNITAAAAACCVGGGLGFLQRRAGASQGESLLWAILGGALVWFAIVRLMRWLARGTRYKQSVRLAGMVATVSAPLGGRRVGEIVYRTDDGGRTSCPARSVDGREALVGAEVIIVDIKDGVALVSPAADMLENKGE